METAVITMSKIELRTIRKNLLYVKKKVQKWIMI